MTDVVVLITGASGFIGRNLAEQLSPEFEVLAPTHAELELLDEEAVGDFFRTRDIDVVIHCATKPGHRNAKDPSNLVYCNTRMFLNLARHSDRFHKMIYLSSGSVYDARFYQPRMPETYFDTHVPSDESGYSKYLCSKYAELSEKIIELRPFGVFGKYEDWQIRFISNMICKALFDLPLTMKQNRRFDYVYIDDLVNIIRHFVLHKNLFKTYNVTPDQSVGLLDLARLVLKVAGKDLEIRIEKPGIGAEYTGDNGRLRKELPQYNFIGYWAAIEKLLQWYERNLESVRKDDLLINK